MRKSKQTKKPNRKMKVQSKSELVKELKRTQDQLRLSQLEITRLLEGNRNLMENLNVKRTQGMNQFVFRENLVSGLRKLIQDTGLKQDILGDSEKQDAEDDYGF